MTLQVVVKPFLSEKKHVSELFQSTTKVTLVDITLGNIVGQQLPTLFDITC